MRNVLPCLMHNISWWEIYPSNSILDMHLNTSPSKVPMFLDPHLNTPPSKVPRVRGFLLISFIYDSSLIWHSISVCEISSWLWVSIAPTFDVEPNIIWMGSIILLFIIYLLYDTSFLFLGYLLGFGWVFLQLLMLSQILFE